VKCQAHIPTSNIYLINKVLTMLLKYGYIQIVLKINNISSIMKYLVLYCFAWKTYNTDL